MSEPMTRESAILILGAISSGGRADKEQALRMAIEALRREDSVTDLLKICERVCQAYRMSSKGLSARISREDIDTMERWLFEAMRKAWITRKEAERSQQLPQETTTDGP